jgi:hypothetical protein
VEPENSLELWKKRKYMDDEGNWWTVEGNGKDAVYIRFPPDNTGGFHYSGSSNGVNKWEIQYLYWNLRFLRKLGKKESFAVEIVITTHEPILQGNSCIWIENNQIGNFESHEYLFPFIKSLFGIQKSLNEKILLKS